MTNTPSTTDAAQALSDLRAVAELGRAYPNLIELLSRLINEGTPILQVDAPPAVDAGDGVVRYKLADELRAALVAVRAGNFDGGELESAGGHASAPILSNTEPSA